SDTLIGKSIWEEFPAFIGTELEMNCLRAASEKSTLDFETFFQPLNQFLEIRTYPSSEGISVYFRDISNRRRIQESLRESDVRLRATFYQAAVGIGVTSLDGRFEDVNNRLCEILGYSSEELVRRTFLDLTHPQDIARTDHVLLELLSGKIEKYTLEKRYVRKDGSFVWCLTSVTLLKDTTGQPEKLIGVLEEITQRKRVEEALRESAQRLQLALSAGNLGDWSWDHATDLTYLSSGACNTFGLPQGTVTTRTQLRELLHPDDRERARITMQTAMANHQDYNIEYRVIRAGQIGWVAAKGRNLYSEDGSLTGMIGVVQDITDRKAAEESRLRLAAVVESSDDAIISMGLDAVIATWNRGAQRMFGYTPEETIGRSVTMLIPTGSENEEPMILERLVKGERIDHYETIRQRKDGSLINVSLTVSPIYDFYGVIIGVSKISRDITETKQQQEALRRSESELQAMADSIPQLAWMAHPDGQVFWYNRRWFEYTGKSFEEARGWGWQSVHDPELLPKVIEKWRESLRTGNRFEMEYPMRGADGAYRWFLTRVQPLRDEQGKVLRWFGTNTDVDEVRRAQQALTEETRVLELLNDTGKAIASQLDLRKVVQTVTDSATALTGAKFGAFFYNVLNEQGESFLLFTLSGAPREAFEKFGNPRATALFGPTFRGEPAIRSADVTKDPRYGKMAPHHGMPAGHLPVRSYLAVPVISRNGEVIGGLFFGHPDVGVFTERSEKIIVGVAAQAAIAIDNARLYDAAQRELIERKKIEAALRAAETELRTHADNLEAQVAERTARLRETIQELEAFSYSVSHDMRSPLRAMQGYSDALLEDYKDKLDETGAEYLNRIRRSARRMDLLIQDVLAYSRVAKGEIELRAVNVENVIRDVIQNYPALQPGSAEITVFSPIPPVLGHEAYLTQLISNLLGNAVKFVSPGVRSNVSIRGTTEGDMVRISFQDNGIGIAEEHQRQVFQIFGRVYSEKKYEGTGIGLAIAKKAAERMGGSLGLNSELGKGSEFFVILKGVP
ncbi:MAG: two-component hybrid sensor and regulator, partial [Verrucomicrobiales bacterium]|nr:two-component hybrid sensor and regulator [Verrucomicrobiales bacterium]